MREITHRGPDASGQAGRPADGDVSAPGNALETLRQAAIAARAARAARLGMRFGRDFGKTGLACDSPEISKT